MAECKRQGTRYYGMATADAVRSSRADTLDKFGATASLLCAVHCALLPFAITLLPLAGLAFLADERIEWALLGLSGLVGTTSLCLGYREHRSKGALALLAAGLGLLAIGHIVAHEHHHAAPASPWKAPLIVVGGLAVAASHLINRRLCHRCRTCHPTCGS